MKKAANPETASMPAPADGSIINQTEVTLQWDAGLYAADVDGHHVYFGDNRDDVNEGTRNADKGLTSSTTYTITDLEPGLTYYWRIDEVNDSHPDKLWRGVIWSFKVQPLAAFNPSPADGAEYVDINADLSWSPGANGKMHSIYFGTTDPPPYKKIQIATTYEPGTLEYDTIYYWRIDEQSTDGTVITGDVWSFRTMPFVPIADPNLVGWWQLDESEGTRAVDSSGYYYHGTLMNGPLWAVGQIEGALQFDGVDDYVDLPVGQLISTLDRSTLAVWVNFTNPEGGVLRPIFNFGLDTDNYAYLSPRFDTAGSLHVGIVNVESGTTDLNATTGTLATGWHHVAVVIEPTNLQIYLDGQSVGSTVPLAVLSDFGVTTDNWLGRPQWPNDAYFSGSLDDFRIYNKVLTQDEIILIMRGDPLLAWNPRPANGLITDVEKVLSLIPLTWSPGEEAARHDVYFGTDADAVRFADTSDTTGLYRGQQDANSFTPAENLVADQTYYWRIDEINTDATVSKGRIWSFTVADYLIVDDFEDYDDIDNMIYYTWEDYYANNTGMTVGYFKPPFAEQTIVHGGSQAMYMHYDNDGTVNEGTGYEKSGTLLYSETERTWEAAQDWARKGVNSLTLWLRGIPASVGSFTIGPPITMTGAGADIWETSDQFHFAYKRLSGGGSITARVLSMTNTHNSAKAGVMIRESLEPDAAHAMVNIQPINEVQFLRRVETGVDSEVDSQSNISTPIWVKLSRSGNTFTGEYSVNGNQWETLGSVTIPMLLDAYIGLIVCSHDTNATCTAEFSDVTMSGTVTGEWQSQDIGIASNVPEQLYVVLQDSAGSSALVKHPDPAATTIDTWTQWDIPLTQFNGVNLQAIKKMAIGVGDRTEPKVGGAGDLYIDDIWLNLP
jgi:regulation of enolase protein 1 (concanavalin A-like superfamily)